MIFQTYLSCCDVAIDAKAARPGSWGKEALWCRELWVEVEDGLEIGSKVGSECLPSSSLKEGMSRAWSLMEEET